MNLKSVIIHLLIVFLLGLLLTIVASFLMIKQSRNEFGIDQTTLISLWVGLVVNIIYLILSLFVILNLKDSIRGSLPLRILTTYASLIICFIVFSISINWRFDEIGLTFVIIPFVIYTSGQSIVLYKLTSNDK